MEDEQNSCQRIKTKKFPSSTAILKYSWAAEGKSEPKNQERGLWWSSFLASAVTDCQEIYPLKQQIHNLLLEAYNLYNIPPSQIDSEWGNFNSIGSYIIGCLDSDFLGNNVKGLHFISITDLFKYQLFLSDDLEKYERFFSVALW